MYELHQALRWIHIAGGAVGILAFWVPAFAAKGGRTHVRAGWVYVWGMGVAVSTALVLSVLLLAAPLAGLRPGTSLDASETARYIFNRRILGAFLGYLAIATFALGWHGLAALRAKRNPAARLAPPAEFAPTLMDEQPRGMWRSIAEMVFAKCGHERRHLARIHAWLGQQRK